MNELELQSRIRLALGRRADCVFFRNAVGVAPTTDGRKVKYGLGKGSPDLIGFLRRSGRIVGLEIKTPGGKTTKEQDQWLALLNSGGGYGRVVYSVEDAMNAVDNAIATADCWLKGY